MLRRTISQELLKLADSRNTDEDLFYRLLGIIEDHLRKAFGVELFIFLEHVPSANGQALVPAWGKTRRVTPIEVAGGELGSLCGFSFVKKKPIWVVAEDQGLLQETTEYRELWSRLDGLPSYFPIPNVDLDAKTLVAIPKTNPTGVFNLEFGGYWQPTSRAKTELSRVVSAAHLAFKRWREAVDWREKRVDDFEYIKTEIREQRKLAFFEKSKIFVAYPVDADLEIVGLIFQVLGSKEISEKVDVIDWKNIHQSGNIDQQIMKRIRESTFGVCYFSEKDESEASGFSDNPNVFFEAGMMQALDESQVPDVRRWIPIREKGSAIPFDLSTQRFLLVERNAGKINRSLFESELKKRVDKLLELAPET